MNKRSMKEYRVWKGMKSRCYSPSQNRGYYKSDNITVCERWRNSFDNFIADMGMMPDNRYSIERLDVHKNYEPSNCVWILQKDQPKNRRNSLMFTIGGETKCLKDWARYAGIKYSTLYKRVRLKGEPIEQYIPEYYGMAEVDYKIREYYGLAEVEE